MGDSATTARVGGANGLRGLAQRIGYVGMSCALILASETFLLARSMDSAPTLLLLVGSQVALCLVLWAITGRGRLFERVSPLWVCVLFLLGVVWAVAVPVRFGAGVPVTALVMPAALLFGLGNSLNVYFLLDFCRLSTVTEFCPVAVGGAAVGAAINYAVSYLMPDYVCALCGVVVFGWYALRQAVSKAAAARRPLTPAFGVGGGNVAALWLAVVALCLGCGFMPVAVFNASGLAAGVPQRLMLGMAIVLLAAALLALAFSGRLMQNMATLAAGAAVSAATGFATLPMLSGVLLSLAASVTLTAQLAAACMLGYLFAQYMGDPGRHPARFWLLQMVVLSLTAMCTFAGILVAGTGISRSQACLGVSLACVWCLLLFYVFFRHIWVVPVLPDEVTGAGDAERRVGEGDVARMGSLSDDVARRCDELSRAHGLTARESEVLHLVAAGWTIDMVARRLVVAPDTVRTHLKHLYPKLGVHSRSELLEMAGLASHSRTA